MLSGEARQRTFHCTGHCPLGGGMVPCLQCVKCLCLFHPECTYMPPSTVNVVQAGAAKFLCPNCYRENKENVGAKKWEPPKPYEPLAYDPSSEDSENEVEKLHKAKSVSNYARVTLQPEPLLTPPSSPPPDYKSQLDAAAMTLSGPKVQTIVTISKAAEASTVVTHSQSAQLGSGPTTVMSSSAGIAGGVYPSLGGNHLLQVQAQGSNAPRFLLVRPGSSGEMPPVHSGTHLGMPRGILLPNSLVGGQVPFMMSGSSPQQQQQQQNTPPPFVFPGSMQQQQQQLPTPVMLSGSIQQQQQTPTSLMLSGSTQTQQQQLVSPVMLSVPASLYQQQVAAMIQQATPMMQQAQEKQQITPKDVMKSKGQDFLRDLSQSYRILLRIFKYLSVKDLLMASRVCLLWRDLAYRPSLWETVRLRNVCVCDWNEFARFLEKRSTSYIDLRKMVFREKLSRNNIEKNQENKEDLSVPSGEKSARLREASLCSSPNHTTPKKGSPSIVDIESSEKVHPSESDRKMQERVIKDENTEDKQYGKGSASQKSSEEIARNSEVPQNSNIKQSNQEYKEKNEDGTNVFDKKDTQDDRTIHGSSDVDMTETGDKGEDMEVSEIQDSFTQKTSKKIESEICEGTVLQKLQNTEEAGQADSYMDCDDVEGTVTRSKEKIRRQSSKAEDSPKETRMKKTEKEIWKGIFSALGSVSCLRGVTLPSCEGEMLQMLLTSCRHLTSVSATELRMTEGVARFDPAYLMEVPDLEELRIGSSHGFCLTTNFNFIKLQQLQLLVMRGLSGPSWPYLGTNLTSLHVGPVSNFTPHTWSNIGSMTNLKALWLEDGGSVNDNAIFDAISRLYKLRRLCLFSFTLGPRLGQALRKLVHLERLFVLPVPSEEGSISSQNGNMLAVPEALRNLDMLVWAMRFQDIHTINEVDHIEMCPSKAKMYTNFTSNEEAKSNMWVLQTLEAIVKRHLPRTKRTENWAR
ncbi:uncharacterized protein [Panulirus ornatus]|uniref:uncharacterized protein n=1 Tax=Panulirus ornatus TaxID=150431 RepID=UPI003A855D89